MRSTSPKNWRRIGNCAASPKTSRHRPNAAADLTSSLLAFSRKQPLMPKDIDIGQKVLGMENCCGGPWASTSSASSCWVGPVAGQRRPGTVGGGASQSGAQCARCDAGGRQADGRGPQCDARWRLCGAQRRGSARRLCHGRGDGYRHRHDPGSRRPRIRAILHHQGVGKGSGLGLSMVYGFAKQSGGSMQIYSRGGARHGRQALSPARRRTAGDHAPPAIGSLARRQRDHSRRRGRRHGADYVEARIEAARLSRHRDARRAAAALEMLRQTAGQSICCSRMS